MANKKYEETDIQAIADAIRYKTGTEDTYKVSDMASGVNEVYEAGKNEQYLDWWRKYLRHKDANYLNQSDYLFGGKGWNDDTFYPPYDLVFAGNNSAVFMQNWCTNIRQRLIDMGVKIKGLQNNSNWGITGIYRFFYGCKTTEIPDMENLFATNVGEMCRGCTNLVWFPSTYDTSKATNFLRMFYDCKALESVGKLDFSSAKDTTDAFSGCSKLSDITIEGIIPISLSFPKSPLTVESMKSVITHLKNYTGTTSEKAYTLTLKSSCVTELETAEFTDEDKTWLEEVGITYTDDLTWVQVIDDLKWNLVTA